MPKLYTILNYRKNITIITTYRIVFHRTQMAKNHQPNIIIIAISKNKL